MVVSQRLSQAYIIIDTEKCKGCRFCITVCPKDIIELGSQINNKGYTVVRIAQERANECTGCLACAIMCPDTAISIYRHNNTGQ